MLFLLQIAGMQVLCTGVIAGAYGVACRYSQRHAARVTVSPFLPRVAALHALARLAAAMAAIAGGLVFVGFVPDAWAAAPDRLQKGLIAVVWLAPLFAAPVLIGVQFLWSIRVAARPWAWAMAPGVARVFWGFAVDWMWLAAIAAVFWASSHLFDSLHPVFATLTLGVFALSLLHGHRGTLWRHAAPVTSGRVHEDFQTLLTGAAAGRHGLWLLPDTAQGVSAYVAGWLPPLRHVVLSRGVAEKLTPDELRAIMAHELGHIRHCHLLKLMGITAGWMVLCWALATLGHPYVAGLAYVPFWGAVLPYVSRRMEFEADCYAARMTSRDAVIAALRRIAALSYMPVELPAEYQLLDDHPSINQRIDRLRRTSAAGA